MVSNSGPRWHTGANVAVVRTSPYLYPSANVANLGNFKLDVTRIHVGAANSAFVFNDGLSRKAWNSKGTTSLTELMEYFENWRKRTGLAVWPKRSAEGMLHD